jgi:hypothetical protein
MLVKKINACKMGLSLLWNPYYAKQLNKYVLF